MCKILSLTFLFYELKSFKKENTSVLVIIESNTPILVIPIFSGSAMILFLKDVILS